MKTHWDGWVGRSVPIKELFYWETSPDPLFDPILLIRNVYKTHDTSFHEKKIRITVEVLYE